MKFNPDIHHRKSIRLKNYDYSQTGLYFITICIHDRSPLFGKIIDGEMLLNAAGYMVANQWLQLPYRFSSIVLHEYIVMPNHFHGVIESVGAIPCGCPNAAISCGCPDRAGIKPAPTIGDVVGAFKSLSTNEYIKNVKQNNWRPFAGKLWQRNYYEHIIRNEESYLKIADYIQTNPLRWQEDTYYENSEQENAKKLASLGGSEPQLTYIPRRQTTI
jgi:REP element-mobilizing transposase RayT